MEPEHGKCSDSVHLQFHQVYSVDNCYSECRQKYLLSKCGCREFFMPEVNGKHHRIGEGRNLLTLQSHYRQCQSQFHFLVKSLIPQSHYSRYQSQFCFCVKSLIPQSHYTWYQSQFCICLLSCFIYTVYVYAHKTYNSQCPKIFSFSWANDFQPMSLSSSSESVYSRFQHNSCQLMS